MRSIERQRQSKAMQKKYKIGRTIYKIASEQNHWVMKTSYKYVDGAL